MNYTTTTNGAKTNSTSGKECLDLFNRIGNMRHDDRLRILEDFNKAYKEDKELATQVLFWARAAREGGGERKTFHTILREIGEKSPAFISDNARTLAELGYWKDLLPYLNIQDVVSTFAHAIKEKDRLACKWAPRKCSVLRDELKMTNKEYRKWLKKHSETVEQVMSDKEWGEINYSSVPGTAMRKYGRAFTKQDEKRFDQWKNDKTTKAAVGATYPHDIFKLDDISLADKQWSSLPNYLENSDERILPMIDTSGSMFGEPMAIAIALGMYLAERNESEFKDMFLSFSEEPELIKITGKDVMERMSNIQGAHWGMNTDFEKAYMHILRLAQRHNVEKDSMPTMLLVLSDMQFDQSQNHDGTHFSHMKDEYEMAGYDFPKLVFWNLSVYPGTPAECSDDNVAMVCGYNPKIMEAVLNAEDFSPMSVMLEALKAIELDYSNLPTEFKYRKEIR